MREMLARGKSVYGGEWVKGYYCPTAFTRFPCKPSIYPANAINSYWHAVEIIPETLGWKTGLTDKNGQRIFEGDIIKYTVESYTDIYLVKWDIEAARFAAYGQFFEDDFPLGDFVYYDPKKCTVIGNIHDNPELIGGV